MPNSNDIQNGISIAEAKAYFQNNLSRVTDESALNPRLKTKTPNWAKSYYYQANGQTMVKVPLVFDNIYYGLGKTHKGKINYNQANYLLLYKDSLKNTKAEWVGLYPDSAWAYGSRNSFTGNIMIRNWAGKLTKLIKFDKGKTPEMYVLDSVFQNTVVNVNQTGLKITQSADLNSKKLMSVPGQISVSGGFATYCTFVPIYTCAPVVQTSPSNGQTCAVPGATTQVVSGYDASCITYPTGAGGTNGPILQYDEGKGVHFEVFIPAIPTSYHGGSPINTYPPSENCVDANQYTGPNTSPTPAGQSHPEQCINPITENGEDIESISALDLLLSHLDLNLAEKAFLINKPLITQELLNYLILNSFSEESVEFVDWSVGYLRENQDTINYNQFFADFFPSGSELIANPDADNWTDPDNEVLSDPDQTLYQEYQDNQPWPTILPIISYDKFVPNRYIPGSIPPRIENCLKLAKEQLAKKGYTVSGYDETSSQLFQTYKEQTGINNTRTREGVSYLITALSNNIPVLVGVDVRSGAPIANKDKSTDHFIVIVGMGVDTKGKYFQFYDSSTNYAWLGASKENKLYYDSATGKITGKTKSQYANLSSHHDFIITQIRKSIKK